MSVTNTITLAILVACTWSLSLGAAPSTKIPHYHPSSEISSFDTSTSMDHHHEMDHSMDHDMDHHKGHDISTSSETSSLETPTSMDHSKDHDMDHHKSHDMDPSSEISPFERMVMDQAHGMNRHKDHIMDDHKDDMGDMDNMTHGMMMEMYFHFGVKEYVLFKEWKITTVGGMVGSVIGVFLMGMLYEGLKYFREYLFKQYISNIQFSTVAITGESGRVTQVHKVQRHRMLSWPHAAQTLLHVVQIVLSYFLMLIFMTYNGWLCISVVLGAGVGYFVFGWKKASVVDITEHCH